MHWDIDLGANGIFAVVGSASAGRIVCSLLLAAGETAANLVATDWVIGSAAVAGDGAGQGRFSGYEGG